MHHVKRIMLLAVCLGLFTACGIEVGIEPSAPAVQTLENRQIDPTPPPTAEPILSPTIAPPTESPAPTALPTDIPPTLAPVAEPEPSGLVKAGEFYGVKLSEGADESSDSNQIEWGDGFCPTGVGVCVRPLSVVVEGDEVILTAEIFGITDDEVNLENAGISLLYDFNTDKNRSSILFDGCRQTTDQVGRYQLGSGHIIRACNRLRDNDGMPTEVEVKFIGGGLSGAMVTYPIGEDLEPSEGWRFNSNARQISPGTPFNLGPYRITIQSIEDLGETILVQADVENLVDYRIGIKNPDWTVIGSALTFATADTNGIQADWMKSDMRAYDLLGGPIEIEESQSGYAVLEKAADEWVLVIRTAAPGETITMVLIP